jgi:hypothetical protein
MDIFVDSAESTTALNATDFFFFPIFLSPLALDFSFLVFTPSFPRDDLATIEAPSFLARPLVAFETPPLFPRPRAGTPIAAPRIDATKDTTADISSRVHPLGFSSRPDRPRAFYDRHRGVALRVDNTAAADTHHP